MAEILPTLEIDRGEPYTRTITISDDSGPIDFTGWSATAKVYDTNMKGSPVTPLIESTPSLDSNGNMVVAFTGSDTLFIQTNQVESEAQFLKRLTKPTYQYVCEIKLKNPSGVLSRLMKARVKVTG